VDNLLAIIPSILALAGFMAIIRLVVRADRLERQAEAKLDRQAAEEAEKEPEHTSW